MWEAGSAKTAAATAFLSQRPVRQRNRLAVRGVRTGSDAASVFRASRRGGARGPVTSPAGQVNAWSVGNAIRELRLTKLSHLHGS